MVETRWLELEGETIRFANHTWELTGDVAIRSTGELIEAGAKQVDDVRQSDASLHFGLENPPASLNPGDLGDHFQELDHEGDRYFLVVTKEPRVYRYELRGMTPD